MPTIADRLALGHDGALRHEERAQMQERDGVTVDRLDRDRLAVRSDPAREGHDPGGGCQHGATEWPLDVDPTVLTGGEWIFLVEVEHLQHRAGNRPAPRAGRGGGSECDERDRDHCACENRVSLPVLQTATTVAGRSAVVKSAYSDDR